MTAIKEKLINLKEQIKAFEFRYDRSANVVKLLAVSKTRPLGDIVKAVEAGQRDFGENYLDEALEKIKQSQSLNCRWHFIGHIQSNKTRAIAEHFDWVHTLDRVKIARRLSEQRPRHLDPLNCCVQINIDAESSKSGIAVDELYEFMEQIVDMPQLRIRGLMVIPAIRQTLNEQRSVFRATHDLFEDLAKHYPEFDTLSMGMTADMEAAIAEGATIVRIGTAVFGARTTSKNKDT